MKKKLIILGIIILVLVLARKFIDINALVSFIESIGDNPFAPAIYVVIYAVSVVFVLPASVFTLIAPPIFGFWKGLLLIVVASNLGCHISYHAAKFMGKDMVLKYIKGGSFLDKATNMSKEKAFIFMMYARLIPLFPFAGVNYLSGVLNINYKSYTLATFLGMLPGSFVYAYLGYTASNITENPLGIAVSISILVIFTIVVGIIGKKKGVLTNTES